MDSNSKEMKRTVPVPSVGAGGEQPNDQINITSITEKSAENNCFDENYEEMLRRMRRMRDPAYLSTISMNELYEHVYKCRSPVIDGLLYPGTYLFAGAPKAGKSFLVARLAWHVSAGRKLWEYEVHPEPVLYLALAEC